MAIEERIPDTALAKELNKASRVVCESLSRSDRPLDARGKIKKGQQRPSNERFVCFVPVPRPLLSPGREIVRETSRRKAHSGLVFSISPISKGGKKQDYEDEDPTSPKVTCIGQVRANKKTGRTNDGIWDEHMQPKLHQSKAGWASPGRFFASPSRPTIWTSLFGSRKESNPPPCTSYAADVSCFGLPCNPPAIMPSSREGKSCGTFLAKSLILLQETEQRGRSKREQSYTRDAFSQRSEKRLVDRDHDPASSEQGVVYSATEKSDPQPPANAFLLTKRKLGSLGSLLKRSSSAPSQDRIKKRGKEGDLQADTMPESVTRKVVKNFQSNGKTQDDEPRLQFLPKSPKGLQESCELYSVLNMEQHRCLERISDRSRASAGADVCFLQENSRVDAIPEATSEQIDMSHEICRKPTNEMEYETEVFSEEMRKVALAPPPSSPSPLRLRRCDRETWKISLDVVPETWLWKNRGAVPLEGNEEPGCEPRRSSSVEGFLRVREEAKHGEAGYGISSAVERGDGEVATASCTAENRFQSDSEECKEHQISTESPRVKFSIEDKKGSNITASQNELQELSQFESGCRSVDIDQALSLNFATNPGQCTNDTKCFDLEKQRHLVSFSGLDERSLKRDVEIPESISKGKPLPDENECVDVEKQKYLISFSGLDADSLQDDAGSSTNKSECLDLEKKSYVLAFSELSDESLHFNSQQTLESNNNERQQTPEVIRHESGWCNEKIVEASCPQSPNTVIFLGYKFETLSFSFNNVNDRQLDRERSPKRNDRKGRLEVGRLSFQGMGRYSQWSRGGTEFLHCCSPTSHPTVIRLKRCNSEPWRPAS